jgi:hypothetical protein
MSTPLDASTRRQSFFESESLDRLVSMVLELATEHWVLRERVYVLERAAAGLGIDLPAAIEAHRLTDAERAELAQMRARMLEQIMRTLFREHRPAPASARSAADRVGREP